MLLACVLALRPFPRTTAPAATPFLAAETLAAQSVFGSLFFVAPQGLAVREHLTGRELLAGRCRIDNLRALGGVGASWSVRCSRPPAPASAIFGANPRPGIAST